MADWTPQSRAEEILFDTINGEPYDGLPQSRIEELLLELKDVIESGGGGGGGEYTTTVLFTNGASGDTTFQLSSAYTNFDAIAIYYSHFDGQDTYEDVKIYPTTFLNSVSSTDEVLGFTNDLWYYYFSVYSTTEFRYVKSNAGYITDIIGIKYGSNSGGGTSDYEQLSNKPSINNVTLVGNKTSDDLGLEGAYTTITYAQWQAMTDAQRESGKYYVTDVPGYDVPIEDVFAPQIYSLSERQVGVWTDGKPLYQKTYEFTITSTGNNIILDSTLTFDRIQLIDSVVSYKRSADGNYLSPMLASEVTRLFCNSNGIEIERNGYDSWMGTVNGVATIKYTKVADTAGSGEWTSQGVPAVHYSTSERVVGTWVDGKTLYQKTIVTNAQVALSDNSWTAVPFASGDVPSDADTMFCTEWFNPSDRHIICDNRTRFIYDNGAIKGATSQIGGQTVPAGLTLTIRYTKAS